MATQTLEFNATTGLTITAKLFALESDTVVATATATERTNDKGRYRAIFTDVAAGDYRLNGFVSSVGGFVNEVYTLLLATDVYLPRSETSIAAVQVLPLSGTVVSRTDGTNITLFTSEQTSVSIAVVDEDGTAVDLTGMVLEIVFERLDRTDVSVIADGSITRSSNTITFTVPTAVTSNESDKRWSLRNTNNDVVLLRGMVTVSYAAGNDA